MAKKMDNEESVEEPKRSTLYDMSRKILLASIGAAVVAQDEIDGFVTRLAERGEIAEADARRLAREMMDRREKMIKDKQAEEKRNRPSVATKADIEALNNRIAELTKRLEEMKKEQESKS